MSCRVSGAVDRLTTDTFRSLAVQGTETVAGRKGGWEDRGKDGCG